MFGQGAGPVRGSASAWLTAALLPALAAAFLSWQSTPALAACSTTTPADGSTVNCTGTETNTIGTGTENHVTVNVKPGASVAVGPDAIGMLLQNQNRVTNDGTISAGDATGGGFGASGGIFFAGDGNTAINNGSISIGNATGGQVFGIQSFGLGATVTNNGTVTIGNGSGIIPYPFDASGIVAFNGSRITNNGTIRTGNYAQGIYACCGNQITNSAGALIQTGNNSFGIFAGGDANTISNAGKIVVGNGTASGFGFMYAAYGILVSGSDTTVTNSGTIQAGNLAAGMAIDDPLGGGGGLYSGNTLINDGTIRAGNGSFGMQAGSLFAIPLDATLINNGSIVVGNAVSGVSPAVGMLAFGPATITNNGSITVGGGDFGTPAAGIYAGEAGSTVVNAGSIAVGAYGLGIRAAGDGTTVKNSGSISVGANGTGIDVAIPFFGADITGPAITNSGTIVAGAGGVGVNFGDYGSLTNTGLIRASGDGLGNGGYSIFACNCTTTAVTNFGILDGKIQIEGPSSTFVNSGLITITDSNAVQPIAPFNFNISDFNHGGGTSFQQTAEGILSLRVIPGALGAPAPIDSLLSDTATLAGTLNVSIQPGLYANTTTTATAVSLTGNGAANITTTFDRFVSSSPFFTVTPIYDSSDPTNWNFLDLQLNRTPFGSVSGETPNQKAVGNALESGYSSGLNPGSAAGQFYANLLAVNSIGVLDQLSGAGTAAAQDAAFTAGGLFNTAMMQQGLAWLNGTSGGFGATFGGLPYAAPAQKKFAGRPGSDAFAAMEPSAGRWRVWGSGFGATRSTDGEYGTADRHVTAAGGAFGVDHEISPDLLVGFAAGASSSHFSVSELSTSGKIDAGHVGIYALKTFGAAYLAATMNYAHGDNSIDRTITGIGGTEYAKGSFDSNQLGGRLELGWRHAMKGYTLTPFAAIEPAVLWQQGYSESSTTGAGAPGVSGLTYQSNSVTSFPTALGLQADARFTLDGGNTLSPFARASWVHEFDTTRNIQASFIATPGAGFTVDGAPAARDALRLESGATLTLTQRASLYASFNTELSDRSSSFAGMGGLRVGW